jgi:hypothetical protein
VPLVAGGGRSPWQWQVSTYKAARNIQNQLQLGNIHNENGNMATTDECARKEEVRRATGTKITLMEEGIRSFPGGVTGD